MIVVVASVLVVLDIVVLLVLVEGIVLAAVKRDGVTILQNRMMMTSIKTSSISQLMYKYLFPNPRLLGHVIIPRLIATFFIVHVMTRTLSHDTSPYITTTTSDPEKTPLL